MPKTTIRLTSFPSTSPPPGFAFEVASVFQAHEGEIGTAMREKGLKSENVLATLREDLLALGFEVEGGKRKHQKILRPVFFGEDGVPTLRYEIDAFNEAWKCGLEVEAGRAWMGNAFYRDLVQAMVMVHVETLILCVPNAYKYRSKERAVASSDYENAVNVAQALYGHARVRMPFTLIVLGY